MFKHPVELPPLSLLVAIDKEEFVLFRLVLIRCHRKGGQERQHLQRSH